MAKNYISKITLPNGITYEIKDVEARDLINQLAVKGISVTVSTTPETTPIGVEWVGDGGTKVIGTLEASAEINSIYLVRSKNASGKDIYDEYIVLKSGEAYVWEKLGDTDISIDDLGDLAYKDSVTGSVEFVDSVTATFTGGVSNVEGKLTPAGNISAEFIGNSLSSTGSYTPEGSVSAELQEDASASVSISYKPSGVVSGSFTGSDMISTGSFTPAGTVTKPNITVSAPKTVGGASKLSTSGSVTRGTLPSFTEGKFTQGSFTQGTDTFVKPVLTTSVTDEVLTISFTQGSFTQGVDNYVKPTKAADTWNAGTVTQVVLPTFNDVDVIHRNEKSGQLNGLFRVRMFRQDDSHNYVTEEQIGSEIKNILEIAKDLYSVFGLEYILTLSTRPDDFMGGIETWNKAEADLKAVLNEICGENNYRINEGDGAFYGPKIDIKMKDCLGREWQMGTAQLDFQLPQRFNLTYIDEDGNKKTPVMIHRALFGSFERFIGIITEHFAGAFPTWLTPVQVKILPISAEKHMEYAKKLQVELDEKGFRVEVDERNEKIGYKIREAQMQKIPYMLVIGDKEIESGSVGVRSRKDGDLGAMKKEDFIAKLDEEVKTLAR